MFVIVATIAIAAILFDLLNFALGVRRLRGDGPSGVPLIGMLLFGIAIGIGWATSMMTTEFAVDKLKWYAVFHFCANFGGLFILDLTLRALGK